MLSLIHDPSLSYPADTDYFSPDARFPEYRLGHLASSPNPVYNAVRVCLAQAGLDRRRLGTSEWNPLGEFVPPGSRVFVLCNFVLDRQRRESQATFEAKCLHGSVLRAVADYLLLAVGENGHVIFGNAPMQHADWDAVLEQTGAARVAEFYRNRGLPVEARDLRLFRVCRNRTGAIIEYERRPDAEGVSVDLGCHSMFAAPHAARQTKYRVINYGSDRLRECHGDGRHSYVINREVLEADVVFSLPKLKTHEKTGITCAMKNCVGTVGHKDSLPHHRFGCPGIGGDEYPADPRGLLRLTSLIHDRVQATRPGGATGNAVRVVDKVVRVAAHRTYPIMEGAWWGNDTAWRMVVDLARAVTYADSAGSLHPQPQRKHLVLVDGVVAGEGEGPLSPSPVAAGLLLFADNPLLADYAGALVMGYRPRRLPTVGRALSCATYPLFDGDPAEAGLVYNDQTIPARELESHAPGGQFRHFEPPYGWKGVI